MGERVLLVLKPSNIHGVGVFAAKTIKKGDVLPLIKSSDSREIKRPSKYQKTICVPYPAANNSRHKLYFGPIDFYQMSIGWYLNHSDTPNVGYAETLNRKWIAFRLIK